MSVRARQNLQDRGLPQTPLYEMQEITTVRAEPDQVVRQTERNPQGRFIGRKAGAIATTLAPKQVFSYEEGAPAIRPHLRGSSWQLDLIDFRSLGGVSGFAMVAVDVSTRKVYGARMPDKSVPSIIAAFQQITNDRPVTSINTPSLIDTDQERGWTASTQWQTF